MLQVVVYLVLAYHYSPSIGTGWQYVRYVHAYTNKEACDAHAAAAEKGEMQRRAMNAAMIAKPHADTPAERSVDAHLSEYEDYVCETVVPETTCRLRTDGSCT